MTSYYWFSKKQQETLHSSGITEDVQIFESNEKSRYSGKVQSSYHTYIPNYVIGNQGDFVDIEHEYTERTDVDKPSGVWDDYKLVAIVTQ